MASTRAEKKASKKHYEEDIKYRKKKIEQEVAKHKANRPKYAKESREYYEDNADYRKYKKRYAREYRKREPVKSKARFKR